MKLRAISNTALAVAVGLHVASSLPWDYRWLGTLLGSLLVLFGLFARAISEGDTQRSKGDSALGNHVPPHGKLDSMGGNKEIPPH
jgi:hypothetical protein